MDGHTSEKVWVRPLLYLGATRGHCSTGGAKRSGREARVASVAEGRGKLTGGANYVVAAREEGGASELGWLVEPDRPTWCGGTRRAVALACKEKPILLLQYTYLLPKN